MNKRSTVHVGLDIHKESIEIALADGTHGGEVRHYGRIGGDLASLDRAVRQFDGAGRSLIFTYEAGPCGYVDRLPNSDLLGHLQEESIQVVSQQPAVTWALTFQEPRPCGFASQAR